MIRIFVLLFVAFFGLTACEDGFKYTPEQRPAGEPTQRTVYNTFTSNSSTVIIIDDGQRSGEHRGQKILACTRMSALQDYLDGYRGYLGCQDMYITTAEDMGYYNGHHIIRFMSQGTFYYGANDYQPPRDIRPSRDQMIADQCAAWYPGNHRAQVECMLNEGQRFLSQ